VRLYTAAIRKEPNNAALYSNRSVAYLEGVKQMGIDTRSMALRDANKAIELKKDWSKAYSRKGDALLSLERFSEAVEAYEQGLMLEPGNGNMSQSLAQCRQLMGNNGRRAGSSSSGMWTAEKSSKANEKVSAREMIERLHTHSSSEFLRGADYREAEMERFRQRKSSSSSLNSTSSGRPSAHEMLRSAEQSFASDNAREYQANLLANYRRKKGNNSSISNYDD